MARNQAYERTPMLPTGFHRSIPPTPTSATFRVPPTPNIAFFGESRLYREQPLQPYSDKGTVFFTDPALKRDVQDFFAFTGQDRHLRRPSRRTSEYRNEAAHMPCYNPADDDLVVWKKRLEAEGGVGDTNAHNNDDTTKSAEDMHLAQVLSQLRQKFVEELA